jgi:hypothetical protein
MDKLGPEQFHVRVDEFFNCDNQPVGLGGIIMEKEHPFDGYHCVCCLRMVDGYDFTTKPGDYLVWIARTKPCVQPNLQKAIFEWVTIDKSAPYICGYGTVAESVQWIQDIYKRTMDSRKLIAGEAS